MATNWEAKFGKGKWVTVRGARVYIQEGKGLGTALQKLAGKKKTIKSPERKLPKLDDSAKKIIKKNEKTIVNAKTSYRNAINSNNLDDSHKAYVALGKAENARSINRELKGRNREPELIRKTGAADYNNAQKKDSENAWVHDGHMASVKAGIKDAQNARKAAGTNGNVRSPIYAPDKKLKLASGKSGVSGKLKASPESMQSFKNNKTAATIKRNEDTIKSVRNDPNALISPLKTAKARIAISENREIKRQNKPGRGFWKNSYDQLHAGDSTFANAYSKRTTKFPKIQQYEVKQNIKEAQDSRKYHGTEGKLRSDVYKDSPQQVAEKKARANKELKDSIFRQATAKATVNAEAIKKREDARKATASANASAELKKLKNTPVKEEDENARLKRQIFLEATAAQKPAQKTKTTSNPVQGKASGSFNGSTRTPTLKEALKEKAGKKTRKK